MAFMSRATHTLQWPVQSVAKPRGGANPESWSQFGLQAATRLHEVGIASNRRSAHCGEYVLESCTRVAMRSCTLVGVNPASLIHNGEKRNTRSFSARRLIEGVK